MQTRVRTQGRRRMEEFSDMDLLAEFNRRTRVSMMEGLNQLASAFMMPTAAPERRRRGKLSGRLDDCDCGCDCEPYDCHCRCCIGDADLVIYARVGERRVITILLENTRRREREIRLELSDWTTRGGGDVAVTGAIQPPAELTLPACSERAITLVVNANFADQDSTDRRRDVDACEVAYADLRIEGCDVRPLRIAVALLPYDCDAYEVACRCSCC